VPPGLLQRRKNYEDAEKGSKGWYCQIYDSAYMDHEGFNASFPDCNGKVHAEISDDDYAASHDGKPRTGVFSYLIDTWRADTLDELAAKLGIEDKAAFLASVERYNELCDKGADEDFGKDAKWMNAIKTAPFYGIRRHLRVSALCSGVYTTPNGEALDGNNAPIPGLYCVGNLGGQFYGGADYPFHATGLSLGRCLTSGALRQACQYIGRGTVRLKKAARSPRKTRTGNTLEAVSLSGIGR
jgi:predicted oxidoreductase